MKKQKAADKLINERCNMDELVAEQIKFNMKVYIIMYMYKSLKLYTHCDMKGSCIEA